MERRRFIVKASGVLAAAGTATVVDAPNVIAQPKVQWRMSTAWTPALDFHQGGAQRLAKGGDEMRGGGRGGELRVEFGVRGVHLPGHGGLLGFFPDDLGRQLLELAQHRYRELDHLDLPLELGLESLQRDRVLRVEVGETIDLHRRGGMVERPPQVDREPLLPLLF